MLFFESIGHKNGTKKFKISVNFPLSFNFYKCTSTTAGTCTCWCSVSADEWAELYILHNHNPESGVKSQRISGRKKLFSSNVNNNREIFSLQIPIIIYNLYRYVYLSIYNLTMYQYQYQNQMTYNLYDFTFFCFFL